MVIGAMIIVYRLSSIVGGCTRSETLNSCYRRAVSLWRRGQAGHDRLAVQPDRAGAALALGATFLRTGQPAVLAQRIEQRFGVRAFESAALAVDRGLDRSQSP